MATHSPTLLLTTSLAVALVAALGCGDAGAGDADPGCAIRADASDAGASCAAPSDPWGTAEGSALEPATFSRCDGISFAFYGTEEGFCSARYTVLALAAGWCRSCRNEAALMQERLVDAYAERGVRVVVALVQDDDYLPPDLAFCERWATTYGLVTPVVIDPAERTRIYYEGHTLPATLIVDHEGVIRYREFGVSAGLETIRAALDALLARC